MNHMHDNTSLTKVLCIKFHQNMSKDLKNTHKS